MPLQHPLSVLYAPPKPEWRFLPEGPAPLGNGRFSWVAIQHGADSTQGSLNLFDLNTGENINCPLPGRPGFAFPTPHPTQFVVGIERRIQLVDIASGACRPVSDEVDADVAGTIINDGAPVPGGVVFGTKDLAFRDAKAGLYLWRSSGELIRLAGGQICSNGKGLVCGKDGALQLIDIDSPTRQIAAYPLDLDAGRLGPRRVLLDLTGDPAVPDGMTLSPDGGSAIVAMYSPHDPESGETRQYDLASGELQAVWLSPGSPRATCPQLIEHEGRVRLIVTTAVEHMTPEMQRQRPHAGCLFIGETPFDRAPPWTLVEAPA